MKIRISQIRELIKEALDGQDPIEALGFKNISNPKDRKSGTLRYVSLKNIGKEPLYVRIRRYSAYARGVYDYSWSAKMPRKLELLASTNALPAREEQEGPMPGYGVNFYRGSWTSSNPRREKFAPDFQAAVDLVERQIKRLLGGIEKLMKHFLDDFRREIPSGDALDLWWFTVESEPFPAELRQQFEELTGYARLDNWDDAIDAFKVLKGEPWAAMEFPVINASKILQEIPQ